jgi:hypothetical protein
MYPKRYYDPNIGRWISRDPAEQFDDPYCYAGNGVNPINGVDVDGSVITSINSGNNQAFLGAINTRSTVTFGFNKNNELYVVSNIGSKNGSTMFTENLIKTIAAKGTLSLNYASSVDLNGQNIPLSKAGEGATITKNGNAAITISGKPFSGAQDKSGNPLNQTPGDILMHEIIGHGVPEVVAPINGNAVRNENRVRQERGQSLRKDETFHVE